MPISTTLIGILGLVVLVVLVIGAVVTRYKVAGPDAAFVITGKGSKAGEPGSQVVTSAGVFVMPVIKQLWRIDLSARRIPVEIHDQITLTGIPLNVEAVATIKVNDTEESIRAAAQRFNGQQQAIEIFANDQLTGALRSIVGELTVEQVTNERTEFVNKVRSVVEETLTEQGLKLDNFEIQQVTSNTSYLLDKARPEAAKKRQEAEIAEAEARLASERSRIAAEEQIAIANRDLALKQAEIQAETDRASADAAAAGPLAKAAREQEVLAQEEQVAVRRAALTERELETTVRKPADAARYQVEQEAEASRTAQTLRADADRAAKIAAAEAQAREAELLGAAELHRRTALAEAAAIEGRKTGEAERSRRAAIAEAVQLEGAADAAAILAKGAAEAEAMDKKAEAYDKYGQAAILEIVAEMLPKMAAEVSKPMAAIDKMTVVSTDGAGALPKTVTANIAQLLEMVGDATGLDVAGMFSGGGAKSLPTAGGTVTGQVAVAKPTEVGPAAPSNGSTPVTTA